MRTVFAKSSLMLCSLVFSTIHALAGAGDFTHVRETAPHYWNWSKTHAQEYFSKSALVEGVVTGDAHILNIGYSFIHKEYRLTLLDIDDVGRAPLFLDFARLVISSKALNADISPSEMLKAYQSGLEGKKPESVDKIKDEFSGKPKWDLKKFENLPKLSESSEKVRHLYKEIENELLQSLRVSKFQDVRVRIKDSGGSQGLVRFWVRTPNDQVYEFKTLQEPSTSSWQSQKSAKERFELAEKSYRDGGSEEFKVVETTKGFFFLRPRFKQPEPVEKLVEKDPSNKNLNKYSLFVAQVLGNAHRQQDNGKDLKDLLEKDFASILEKLNRFQKNYIEDLTSAKKAD